MHKSILILLCFILSTGSLFAADNDVAQAELKRLEVQLKKNPTDVRLQILHADKLDDLKRYDEELIEAKKIVARYPNMRNGYCLEQQAYCGLKQNDLALLALNSAIALGTPSSQELNIKATLLAKTGKFKEAIGFYNEVLKQSPTNADAYACRGGCYYQLYGPSMRSIEDLEKGVALDPTNLAAKQLLEEVRMKMSTVHDKGH